MQLGSLEFTLTFFIAIAVVSLGAIVVLGLYFSSKIDQKLNEVLSRPHIQ